MAEIKKFNVKMDGNLLLIGIYGSIGDKLKDLNESKIPPSDKVLTLNLYLTGLDLGVFLGSDKNISIDIDGLPLVGKIKETIAKFNNKEISAEKAWKRIIFDNVIMSGVV